MDRPPLLNGARTSVLEIAYEESGPAHGAAVLLMHGFPYDPRTYDDVVPSLAEAGCRVIVPYLRGYGPTRFLAPDTLRSGQQAALGNDLKELMDALALERAMLAGYDWGGRAACIVAALWPERVRGLVSANGYNIQDIAGSAKPAPVEQEYRLWYQYHVHTEGNRRLYFCLPPPPPPPPPPRDCRPTGASFVDCCGDCGRRIGSSMTRPMTAPQRRSTIRTSSTL
jgi:pimeloyl-ACP methyl ester carboxylesterase